MLAHNKFHVVLESVVKVLFKSFIATNFTCTTYHFIKSSMELTSTIVQNVVTLHFISCRIIILCFETFCLLIKLPSQTTGKSILGTCITGLWKNPHWQDDHQWQWRVNVWYSITRPYFIEGSLSGCTGSTRSRGSSVSIVTDYGLDDWGLIPDRGRGFSSSLCVQTGSGAHPASCPMGNGASFPRGKEQLGHDVDHSPPSSAEVKYK
jgi:hypothetical protein